MATTYGQVAKHYDLPPPEPTPPAIFSVPRPGGGFVYYQAPAGTAPGLGDNWPLPSLPHKNPIGVASVAMGRELPPGSVRVGEGDEARGSITPLPGAGGDIPGLDASLGSYGDGVMDSVTGPFGVAVALAGLAVGWWWWGRRG